MFILTGMEVVKLRIDSGCGTLVTAVAFNIRDPRFESDHRKLF